MNTIYKILILVMSIGFVYNSYAVDTTPVGPSGGEFSKVGAAGAQFLKLGVGAKAEGMAGAYTAVTSDLTAIYWNPAGLSDIKGLSGTFAYASYFAGSTHNFAAVALPIGSSFTAGFSFNSFGASDIPITTFAEPDGTGATYDVSDVSLSATIAGYLTEQFSFGITTKFISNGFRELNASGVAFDIGTRYETGLQGITLGFSIHNLGTEQTYSGVDLQTQVAVAKSLNIAPQDAALLANAFQLPLQFRAGISAEVYKEGDHDLIGAIDFLTQSDVSEQFAVGAQYTWRDLLFIRTGYRFGHDQLGFAGGVGFKYVGGGFNGEIDYSINPTSDIGLINRIAIAIGVN